MGHRNQHQPQVVVQQQAQALVASCALYQQQQSQQQALGSRSSVATSGTASPSIPRSSTSVNTQSSSITQTPIYERLVSEKVNELKWQGLRAAPSERIAFGLHYVGPLGRYDFYSRLVVLWFWRAWTDGAVLFWILCVHSPLHTDGEERV